MTDRTPPKIIQDEFSIARGSATFRLIWSDVISSDDKVDLLEWLKLVERRIQRLPEVGPPAPDQKEPTHG